jgi:peptidoglycan hydrolase CwlO-like protein
MNRMRMFIKTHDGQIASLQQNLAYEVATKEQLKERDAARSRAKRAAIKARSWHAQQRTAGKDKQHAARETLHEQRRASTPP